MMLKLCLLIAFFGHLLCWYSDCLITYTPGGRLSAKQLDLKDNAKIAALFRDMPLNRPMRSILLGIFALVLSGFGLLALCSWMRQFSEIRAVLMQIGAVLFIGCAAPHHMICGLLEWLYIRLGHTADAAALIMELFKKTAATMIVCYLGLLLFSVTLFLSILTGVTTLPAWACIFTTLPLFLILSPFKVAGAGNIANALMFLVLTIII